jgi:hypothetical protein
VYQADRQWSATDPSKMFWATELEPLCTFKVSKLQIYDSHGNMKMSPVSSFIAQLNLYWHHPSWHSVSAVASWIAYEEHYFSWHFFHLQLYRQGL